LLFQNRRVSSFSAIRIEFSRILFSPLRELTHYLVFSASLAAPIMKDGWLRPERRKGDREGPANFSPVLDA